MMSMVVNEIKIKFRANILRLEIALPTQEKNVKVTGKKYAKCMLTDKEKQINLHAK